jgi:hypothetical protein
MKISDLILALQEAHREHGDTLVTGGHFPGHPELTITGAGYAPAGPLPKSPPNPSQVDLPERFVLSWEDL